MNWDLQHKRERGKNKVRTWHRRKAKTVQDVMSTQRYNQTAVSRTRGYNGIDAMTTESEGWGVEQ